MSSPVRMPTGSGVTRGRPDLRRVPVLFDPVLDVALLARRGCDLPALAFADRIRSAAPSAAALGYPGGGALTIVPAAVAGRYPATGLDIYGDERVRREILELRAAIERGDSGGPLILDERDGGWGGVCRGAHEPRRRLRPAPSASRRPVRPGIGRTTPGRHRRPASTDPRALHCPRRCTTATGPRPDARQETPSVSDRPSDPAKRHSAAITDGPDRAGARAMLKAVGFTDEDLAKPLVGVGTTWIETMPCNINQRELAEHVKAGIRAAGGTPMEFNTIAISDGVTMGTEGMKASLVSREVVADSIELVVRGQMLDGVVCVVACDKTGPARRWPSAGSTSRASSSTAGRSTRASTRASETRRS